MKAIRTKRTRQSDLEREERSKRIGPRPDFQVVHDARKLRELLKAELTRLYGVGQISDCSDELVDAVLKQTRFWLMDHCHSLIMTRQHALTPLINNLIENLGENKNADEG